MIGTKVFIVGASLLFGCVAGCAHVNNPYEDSSTYINEDMKTASSEAYASGTPEFPRDVQREWKKSNLAYENGAVTHWPVWFDDPFQYKGNGYCPVPPDKINDPDNTFAWNGVDYLDIAYSPARFVLNTVAWPVSAVVTPPGTLMESDGYLSKNLLGQYDFDEHRAVSANREPPHMSTVNKNTLLPEPLPADQPGLAAPPEPAPAPENTTSPPAPN